MKTCALCYNDSPFINHQGICGHCSEILKREKIAKRKAIWLRDGKRCRYCGVKVSQAQMTLDHVKPKSRGGMDTFWNSVCSCKNCNENKGNKTLKEAKMEIIETPGNYFRNR